MFNTINANVMFAATVCLLFRHNCLILYLILAQETLREFGIVFWCHHEMRFTSSDIDPLRSRAEAVGLVTWPSLRHPVSAYTHDGMLQRFGVERRSLRFVHMAEPETALYANTYRLHHRLMKPWVQCALDINCLAPFGARVSNFRPEHALLQLHSIISSVHLLLTGNSRLPRASCWVREPTAFKQVSLTASLATS